MNKKLEKIFNECIERLLQGETIDDCLKSYPEQANKLEPLLKTAVDISWKATKIEPRPVFKSMARARVQGAFIYAQQQKQQPKRSGFFSLQRAWVPALSIVLVLILSGAGTVAASSGALPDQVLYPVKEAAENARVALTFTDAGKAELYVHLSEVRSQEIAEMAIQGKADIIVEVTEKLTDHLEKADEAIKRIEASEIAQIQEPKPITVMPATTEGQKKTDEEPSQQEAAPEKPSAATANVTTGEGGVSEETSRPEATSEETSTDQQGAATADGKGKETDETSKPKSDQSDLLRKKLKDSLSNNLQILQDALNKTPEKSRVALIKAIEASNKTRDQIQKEIGESDNGNTEPADIGNKKPDENSISDNITSPGKQSKSDQLPTDNTTRGNGQPNPVNSSTDNKTGTENSQPSEQPRNDNAKKKGNNNQLSSQSSVVTDNSTKS